MITTVGEEIIKLRREGLSLKSIRAKIGCSSSTVSKYCNLLSNNAEIIQANIARRARPVVGSVDFHRKEMEILRRQKPDDPSWFSNYKARLREASKAFLMNPADGKCQVCQYDRHPGNLVFHHHDPLTKLFGLNGMKLTYNLRRLVEEASKCSLLCHNCHNEVHADIIGCPNMLEFGEVPDNVIVWHWGDPS